MPSDSTDAKRTWEELLLLGINRYGCGIDIDSLHHLLVLAILLLVHLSLQPLFVWFSSLEVEHSGCTVLIRPDAVEAQTVFDLRQDGPCRSVWLRLEGARSYTHRHCRLWAMTEREICED